MKTSLDALHPIYVPPEVGFFPLTDGYIALGVFFASLLVSFVAFRIRAFRKNRFKREALRELARKRETLQASDVFELLKRVALSCDYREKVASLSGAAFLKYFDLDKRSVVLKAHRSVYDVKITLSDEERKELYRLAVAAIKRAEYVRD